MTKAETLYDEDFVAWTEQQAEALRAAARGNTNQQLDWENLAEEVESLGASERRELRSQIQRIIRHLIKLQFSPADEPRRGWIETVSDARAEIELLFEASPSLKGRIDEIVEEELGRGARAAIRDLERYGEIGRAVEAIRAVRYEADQILGDWFPAVPERPSGLGE